MTSINDISDLARILRANPEWADILRDILLGNELLQLPKQLAEFVSATNNNFQMVYQRMENLESGQVRLEGTFTELQAGQARLEGDVTELKAGQARLESGQTVLTSRLGNLIGSDYERQVADSIPRRIRHYVNTRRPRVVYGRAIQHSSNIPDLLSEAVDRNAITDDLLATDLILLDETPLYIGCEVAVTAYNHDVLRSKRRARILE